MTDNYKKVKEWRKNNPEKFKKQKRTYRKNHPEETKKEKEKYYNKNKKNDTNKRRPYTIEEIDMILNKDFSDTELAKILKRSMIAIQIVRSRHKNG